MSERTAVYRMYDTDWTLLYVGVAKRLGARWDVHAKQQPWWDQVKHQTVTWYPNRDEAEAVEETAIRDERPVYNIRRAARLKNKDTGFTIASATESRRQTVNRDLDGRETITLEEAAVYLGASSPGSARKTLSRLQVKAVGRSPGLTSQNLYDTAEVQAAKAAMPGRGKRAPRQQATRQFALIDFNGKG